MDDTPCLPPIRESLQEETYLPGTRRQVPCWWEQGQAVLCLGGDVSSEPPLSPTARTTSSAFIEPELKAPFVYGGFLGSTLFSKWSFILYHYPRGFMRHFLATVLKAHTHFPCIAFFPCSLCAYVGQDLQTSMEPPPQPHQKKPISFQRNLCFFSNTVFGFHVNLQKSVPWLQGLALGGGMRAPAAEEGETGRGRGELRGACGAWGRETNQMIPPL